MITAAFEWEFKRMYPDGVKRNAKKIEAENAATEHLKELIEGNTGEVKSIYKFLKKIVKTDSLQKEIQQVGKDFGEIINVFGNRLYSLNKESMKYNKMGERLSKQRNNFAHGNLDKEFIGNSLLDLIYLEYVVYAMQLRQMGLSNENIQKSINDLFSCRLAL